MFFVDAAHFVLGSFLGYLWCLTRVFVRASSGRQRYNVLGAINALTRELVRVSNDSYITATTVCELLVKLKALNLATPITVVLDNARYQRNAVVQALAHDRSTISDPSLDAETGALLASSCCSCRRTRRT